VWHVCDLASRKTYHSATFSTKYVIGTAFGAMKFQRLTAWPMSRPFFIYLLLAIKIYSWPLLTCATTHELHYHMASASRKKNYSLSFTHKSDLLFWHQKRIYDTRLFWAWWKMDYAVLFCVLNLFFGLQRASPIRFMLHGIGYPKAAV